VLRARFPPKGRELEIHDPPPTGFAFQAHQQRQRPRRTRRSSSAPTRVEHETDTEPLAAPNGITSQDGLLRFCVATWLERSKGEIEGKIVTPMFRDEFLNLWHSDRITIQVNPGRDAEALGSSDAAALRLARDYGIDVATARVLIGAVREFPVAQYSIRSLTAEYTHEGTSTITVEFISLFDIDNVTPEQIDQLIQAAE
jgi:hypothetical protein